MLPNMLVYEDSLHRIDITYHIQSIFRTSYSWVLVTFLILSTFVYCLTPFDWIRNMQDFDSSSPRRLGPAVILSSLVLGGVAHKLLNSYTVNLGIPQITGKSSAEVVPGYSLGELRSLAALV
jgi:hypothetical protein